MKRQINMDRGFTMSDALNIFYLSNPQQKIIIISLIPKTESQYLDIDLTSKK